MANAILDLKNYNLCAPWVERYAKISAFFKEDKDVVVILDAPEKNVRVYVKTTEKAEALDHIMKKELRDSESDTLLCTVSVIPPNDSVAPFLDGKDVIKEAFKGNPIMRRIEQGTFPFGFTYVIFQPKVVRYHNDSLAEWDQCGSTLYQEIAKEIFEPQDGVFWTTDAVLF